MKIFITTVLLTVTASQLLTGCGTHPRESASLIQGKSVPAWVGEVEITVFPNKAIDVLNGAGPAIMPRLTRLLLEEKSPELQAKAAFAMSGICYRNPKAPEVYEAIPALMAAAQNSDSEVRIYSVQALGATGKAAHRATSVLLRLTKDENASVRMCAVEALGRIGAASPKSVAALTVALSDASDDVRVTARRALETVQSDRK